MSAVNMLPTEMQDRTVDAEGALAKPGLKTLVADYERTLILNALNESQWHQRRAAASLGLLPTTLLEKMKRLGIRRVRAADPMSALVSDRFLVYL